MAPMLDFDMIFGVGMWLLRKLFLFYLVLLVQRMILFAAQVEFSRGAIQCNTGFAKADHDYEVMPWPRSLGCCM
jgi:hypothetical protein